MGNDLPKSEEMLYVYVPVSISSLRPRGFEERTAIGRYELQYAFLSIPRLRGNVVDFNEKQ